MRHIAENIHGHASAGQTKEYSVFFAPRRTMLCERALEELGVYGNISIGEYQMELIPFDDDVLSLEMDGCFTDCFLVRAHVLHDVTQCTHFPTGVQRGVCGRAVVVGSSHCAKGVDCSHRIRTEHLCSTWLAR